MAAPLDQTEITSDINEFKKLKNDSRMGPSYVTNKSAYEILKLVKDSKLEIKNIKLPILIIHGDIDQISLLEGGQYLYDNITNNTDTTTTTTTNNNNNNNDLNKQLLVIPNGKHELLHEVKEIKTLAMNTILNYIENQYNSIVIKK